MLLSICSFSFFLINFYMGRVKGSLVLNTIFSQAAEMSANYLSMFIYAFLGAKLGFLSMFVLSIVGSILLIIFFSNLTLLPVFIICAKFGIAASFNMCFMGFVQLIPTIFSTRVFGFCNVLARTVTVLSP